MANPAIIISEQDLHRLETMLEHQPKLTPTMQLLEEELATQREEMLTKLEKGMVLKGIWIHSR